MLSWSGCSLVDDLDLDALPAAYRQKYCFFPFPRRVLRELLATDELFQRHLVLIDNFVCAHAQ